MHGGTACQAMQARCLLMYHPFSGGSIIYSLVAYPMGAGRTRIEPGKQTEKGGRKAENRKRCGNLAAACHWWKFSGLRQKSCFPFTDDENGAQVPVWLAHCPASDHPH